METPYVEDLVNAAIEQAQASAGIRVIARDAWAAAAEEVTGMDAFATGSLARWECGIASDIDFNFLAANDDELRANGLRVARVTTLTIRDRWRWLHRGAFWRRYQQVAEGLGYDFADTRTNGVVLAVHEFDRNSLPASLFARSGANYFGSVLALRETTERRGRITPMLASLSVNELRTTKLQIAEDYLGRFRAESHPHPAHGVTSQVWQAILFSTTRQQAPPPFTPYWAAPLYVSLDRGGQATWHVFSLALNLLRSGGSSVVADQTLVRALLDLARCARSDGFIDAETELAIRRALQ